MGRMYEIELSCGCLISLDGGGGLIPCHSNKCKYFEEYQCSPNWVEWETEVFANNYYQEPPTERQIAEVRKANEKRYFETMKKMKSLFRSKAKGEKK